MNAETELLQNYDRDAILGAAASIVAEHGERQYGGLTSPAATQRYLQFHIGCKEKEHFAVLYLDSQHRVIDSVIESSGTVDAASVYPREIVKSALQHNAAAVILAHNHPSGVAEPSCADQKITARLKEVLALVGVRVLDHFVVAGSNATSFAERGLI